MMSLRKTRGRARMRKDIILAHHEAAHAATAEALYPGSVRGVTIEGVWAEGESGWISVASEVSGQVVFDQNIGMEIEDYAVVLCASRPGEQLVSELIPEDHDTFYGDDRGIRWATYGSASIKNRAEARAEALVTELEGEIRSLAEELLTRRRMTGDEVRGFLWR